MGQANSTCDRRRCISVAGMFVCLLLALAGCGPATASAGNGPPRAPAPYTGTICATTACAAHGVQVFVEPDAGEAPVLRAIKGATISVWVEVYEMTDTTIKHALEDAANRGVDLRVLLEAHPFGGGDVQAQQTLEELAASGVHTQASDPAFTYTHAKLLLVDGVIAYILTANLSRAGLGGNSISANREYGVVDADAGDVAEVRVLFQADWDRRPPSASAYSQPRLVVSPVNARATRATRAALAALAALIASAQRTLVIQDEEMYDTASEDALIAAARRGVSVEIVLPPPSGSSSYAPDVARLTTGGVHVRYLTAPYMHAKLVVADSALAFTSSENFSATSLDQNREVGIMIADPAALATFAHVVGPDWALGVDA